MTREQIIARFPNASEDFIRSNLDATILTSEPPKTMSNFAASLAVEKMDKPKKELLNKTETLWKSELERRGHKIILAQALTFRLGDRLTYRPDFVTIDLDFKSPMPGAIVVTAYETKAPHRFKTAGVTKVKAAAIQYPFIRFVLVMRDKSKWTEREIGQ